MEIDFASSLLRRYAAAFEAQGGRIIRDKRGGRIYPASLLEHFRATRDRVRDGELLEEAMRTLDLAVTNPVQDVLPHLDAKQLLSHFEERLAVNRLETLTLIDERLTSQKEALLEGLKRIEARLNHPEQANKSIQQELQELRHELSERLATPKPSSVIVVRTPPRQLELENQNRELAAELERIKLDAAIEERRPWWRWGRP